MKLPAATLSMAAAAVFALAAGAPTLCAAAPSTVWAAHESDHPRPGFDRAEDLAEQCFWWNATAAAVQFYRPACVDYALSIAWWTPAWAAALLFLAAFPVVFLVARYKCNCCGGRYPSFSCCFPSDDEPHWFGRYSTPSVGCHIAVLLLCLAPVIGCGVMSITNNAVLNDKLDTVLQPLPAPDHYLGQLRTFAATAATMTEQHVFDLDIVPPSVATTLQVVTHYAQSRVHEASSGLSTAETVEYYRVRAHYGVLGATLAVVLVTGTVSLLRLGVVLPVMQLLLAWCGAAVVLSAGVTGGLKVTQDAACDAWGASTLAIAAGAADGSPLCNRADIRSAVNSIEVGLHNALTESQNNLCTTLSSTCDDAFSCPDFWASGLCYNDNEGGASSTEDSSMVTFDATALERFMRAATNGDGTSMWECGVTSGCSNYNAVQSLYRFSHMSTRLVLAAYNVSQSDSKCQWVSEYLNANVHDRICNHDLNDDLTWTTIWSGLVAVFVLLALFPVIRGIKRFRSVNCCPLQVPSCAAPPSRGPFQVTMGDNLDSTFDASSAGPGATAVLVLQQPAPTSPTETAQAPRVATSQSATDVTRASGSSARPTGDAPSANTTAWPADAEAAAAAMLRRPPPVVDRHAIDPFETAADLVQPPANTAYVPPTAPPVVRPQENVNHAVRPAAGYGASLPYSVTPAAAAAATTAAATSPPRRGEDARYHKYDVSASPPCVASADSPTQHSQQSQSSQSPTKPPRAHCGEAPLLVRPSEPSMQRPAAHDEILNTIVPEPRALQSSAAVPPPADNADIPAAAAATKRTTRVAPTPEQQAHMAELQKALGVQNFDEFLKKHRAPPQAQTAPIAPVAEPARSEQALYPTDTLHQDRPQDAASSDHVVLQSAFHQLTRNAPPPAAAPQAVAAATTEIEVAAVRAADVKATVSEEMTVRAAADIDTDPAPAPAYTVPTEICEPKVKASVAADDDDEDLLRELVSVAEAASTAVSVAAEEIAADEVAAPAVPAQEGVSDVPEPDDDEASMSLSAEESEAAACGSEIDEEARELAAVSEHTDGDVVLLRTNGDEQHHAEAIKATESVGGVPRSASVDVHDG